MSGFTGTKSKGAISLFLLFLVIPYPLDFIVIMVVLMMVFSGSQNQILLVSKPHVIFIFMAN